MCEHWDLIHPIMGDRTSSRPLFATDSLEGFDGCLSVSSVEEDQQGDLNNAGNAGNINGSEQGERYEIKFQTILVRFLDFSCFTLQYINLVRCRFNTISFYDLELYKRVKFWIIAKPPSTDDLFRRPRKHKT